MGRVGGRNEARLRRRSTPPTSHASVTQIEALLDAGCRIFHFDVGDGHFIPPVTIGPVVLRSIAPMIHDAGGVIDCHLMVADPAHHFPEFASSGADSVTFHVEAAGDPRGVGAAARALGLAVGVAFNPDTDVADAVAFAHAAGAELILCMSIVPGYSGQPFLPESYARIAELAEPRRDPDPGRRRRRRGERGCRPQPPGRAVFVAGNAVFADPDPVAAYRRIAAAGA